MGVIQRTFKGCTVERKHMRVGSCSSGDVSSVASHRRKIEKAVCSLVDSLGKVYLRKEQRETGLLSSRLIRVGMFDCQISKVSMSSSGDVCQSWEPLKLKKAHTWRSIGAGSVTDLASYRKEEKETGLPSCRLIGESMFDYQITKSSCILQYWRHICHSYELLGQGCRKETRAGRLVRVGWRVQHHIEGKKEKRVCFLMKSLGKACLAIKLQSRQGLFSTWHGRRSYEVAKAVERKHVPVD